MQTYSIRHVGVATSDSKKLAQFFVDNLGAEIDEVRPTPADEMESTFVRLGANLLELMQPWEEGKGTIGKYISKKGDGIHHISLAVTDADGLIESLAAKNIPMLPPVIVDTHKAFFIHPKACGLLIEVVEYDYCHRHPERVSK